MRGDLRSLGGTLITHETYTTLRSVWQGASKKRFCNESFGQSYEEREVKKGFRPNMTLCEVFALEEAERGKNMDEDSALAREQERISPLHRRKLSRTRESDVTNSEVPVITKTLMEDALKWEKQDDSESNPLVKHLVTAKVHLGNAQMRLKAALSQTKPEQAKLREAITNQIGYVNSLLEHFPLVVK